MKTFVNEKNKIWISTFKSIKESMSSIDIDSLEIDNSTKDVLKKIIKSITDLQKLHEND
jgi:hypothetical protein